jgi:hypothetical protein
MKYLIKIPSKYKSELFKNYSYVYKFDNEGIPIRTVIVDAKNKVDAVNKLRDIKFCKSIGIPEELLFQKFILETGMHNEWHIPTNKELQKILKKE